MKNLFVLFIVLSMISATSATVSFVELAPGEPGSASNPILASDEIMVYLTTDEMLLSANPILYIDSGPASIVGATGVADAADYGWDPSLSFDPIIDGDSAEMGLGNFNGHGPGVIGYFLLHCEGPGEVVLSLGWGGYWAAIFPPPWPASGDPITIYQIPEPATFVLLCLGIFLVRRSGG